MDILLFSFICTQEFNDASHLESLMMQSRYTVNTVIHAGIIAHMLVNIVCCVGAWIVCGLALTQGEGHFIACAVIYFIIGYETLFHIVPKASMFLDLDSADSVLYAENPTLTTDTA